MPDSNHIILVEDDDSFASSIEAVLVLLGWRVTHAASGKAALAAAARDKASVAIVDANLGEMNGPETIVRLRAACPGIRTIGMSGREAFRSIMLAAGASHFVLKPFIFGELAQHLQRPPAPETAAVISIEQTRPAESAAAVSGHG